MPLSVGDRLGSYQVLAPIGAGGMGYEGSVNLLMNRHSRNI